MAGPQMRIALRIWYHKQRRSGLQSAPYILSLKAEVLGRNGIKTPVQQSYCGQNHHAGFREIAIRLLSGIAGSRGPSPPGRGCEPLEGSVPLWIAE
jgi:hypothetical protein